MAIEIGFHQRQFAVYAEKRNYSLEGFDCNGNLFVNEPKKRLELPLRQMMLFLLAVVSFKVFLFFVMGAASYGAKIEALSGGNMAERVAARIMVLDPVSDWLAKEIQFRIM